MSASDNQLEAAMQSAWDRGHDPFEDAHVLALLEAQPERLEQAAQWRSSVSSLRELTTVAPAVPQPATAQPATAQPATPQPATPQPTTRPQPIVWLTTAVAAAMLAMWLWPTTPPTEQPTRPQLRVLQSSLTQRIEHHGSACSVREVRHHTHTPPTTVGDFQLTSQLVQRTQTSLTR